MGLKPIMEYGVMTGGRMFPFPEFKVISMLASLFNTGQKFKFGRILICIVLIFADG